MSATVQNTAELRSFNTKRIIEYMRGHGASTKKNVTDALELSFATVSNICNALLADGILVETGTDDFSGGRLPKLLSLCEASRLTLCLYLLKRDVYDISIADLKGKELKTATVRTDGELSMIGLIDRFYAASESMLAEMGRSFSSVLGLCVAAPGIYNKANACIINSTDPLFENQPLGEALERRYELPVYIENESNLLVTAASISDGVDEAKKLRDIIYLYIGEGLGVGIISDGGLVMGSRGLGGEIEHMPMGFRDYACYCGHSGCVEPELVEEGFLRKWAEDEKKAGLGEGGDWADFLSALRSGQAAAVGVVEENGRLIGRLLSVLVNIFDPEIVYIGGIVEGFFETIRPIIAEELEGRMVAKASRHISIVNDADYRAMILKGSAARVFNEWRA